MDLADLDGIEATRLIKAAHTNIRVIGLFMFADAQYNRLMRPAPRPLPAKAGREHL